MENPPSESIFCCSNFMLYSNSNVENNSLPFHFLKNQFDDSLVSWTKDDEEYTIDNEIENNLILSRKSITQEPVPNQKKKRISKKRSTRENCIVDKTKNETENKNLKSVQTKLNSQTSYSVFEDSLILNSRKKNKIFPEREKFKNLSKLAQQLNRTSLGVQNRSRFLMKFNQEDQLKIIKFASENELVSKTSSISWVKSNQRDYSNQVVKDVCLLEGFVLFQPNETKKRLYKERTPVKGNKATEVLSKDEYYFDDNQTLYQTSKSDLDSQPTLEVSDIMFQNAFVHKTSDKNDDLDNDDLMSCFSLVFNQSNPEDNIVNRQLLSSLKENSPLGLYWRRQN